MLACFLNVTIRAIWKSNAMQANKKLQYIYVVKVLSVFKVYRICCYFECHFNIIVSVYDMGLA